MFVGNEYAVHVRHGQPQLQKPRLDAACGNSGVQQQMHAPVRQQQAVPLGAAGQCMYGHQYVFPRNKPTANSLRRKAYVLSADVSLGLLRLRDLLHPDIGAQLAELAHQILVATLDILYLRQLRFALSGQTGDDQSRTGP